MHEGPPTTLEPSKSEREQKIEKIVALVKELSENTEGFPFPGIEPDELAKMKATDEEFPGFSTTTDEIVRRMENEGIKVVLGEYDPQSGNVFILPKESDSMDDSIRSKQLQIDEAMDERLKELILITKT